MSETDPQRTKASKARVGVQLDAHMRAYQRRILDLLHDRGQEEEADVPLHQRGFGVMDEPEEPRS